MTQQSVMEVAAETTAVAHLIPTTTLMGACDVCVRIVDGLEQVGRKVD